MPRQAELDSDTRISLDTGVQTRNPRRKTLGKIPPGKVGVRKELFVMAKRIVTPESRRNTTKQNLLSDNSKKTLKSVKIKK